jgi:hypothetical protein
LQERLNLSIDLLELLRYSVIFNIIIIVVISLYNDLWWRYTASSSREMAAQLALPSKQELLHFLLHPI